MFKVVLRSLILILGVGSVPGFAGTIYIPILSDEINGISYETRVTVSNNGKSRADFTTRFFDDDSPGVARENTEEQSYILTPGQTFVLELGPEYFGLLEIEADEDLAFSARLTPMVDGGEVGLGGQVPVITSANVVPSDVTAQLQDWRRSEAKYFTDFGVVTLGSRDTNCMVDVFRAGGAALVANLSLLWQPLSVRHFHDALKLLGESNATSVRAAITCDQDFYPYGVTVGRETGEVVFIRPSGLGSSALQPPGSPFECPQGAVCFEEQGTFFVPTLSAPTRGISMNVPPGSYTKIKLHMEVLHGGWQSPSSGLHNIFCFVLGGNRDQIGYVNFLGPNRDILLVRHGMGLSMGQKPRIERPFVAVPGEVYTFDYLYDTQARVISLLVSNRGQQVASVFAAPNVNRINVPANKNFLIGLSFEPGLNPNEPPTYGWQYRNLIVEYHP